MKKPNLPGPELPIGIAARWLSVALFIACQSEVQTFPVADAARTGEGGASLSDTFPKPDRAVGDPGDAMPTLPVDAKPDAATTAPAQKFLFAIHYDNQIQHIVFTLTNDGNVSRSTQPSRLMRNLDYTHDLTEEQILAHQGGDVTVVATVPPDVLRTKHALVPLARQGELCDVNACVDFGSLDYLGFGYSATTGRYDAIRLGSDGDWAVKNTMPEAQALAEWLAGIWTSATNMERECRYNQKVCGMARSLCDVADCAECAALDMICVVDQQKQAHCKTGLGACAANPTCACLGDIVCGGGAGFCAGTVASGFTCSAR